MGEVHKPVFESSSVVIGERQEFTGDAHVASITATLSCHFFKIISKQNTN